MYKLLLFFWVAPLWSYWVITEVSPLKTQYPEFIELACTVHCNITPKYLQVGTREYALNCSISTEPFAIWLITSVAGQNEIKDKLPQGITTCVTKPALNLPDKGAAVKIQDSSHNLLDSLTYPSLKKGTALHRNPSDLVGYIKPPTPGIPTGPKQLMTPSIKPTIPKSWRIGNPLILNFLEPAKVLLISRSGKVMHESASQIVHVFNSDIASQIPTGFYWLRIIYTPKNQYVKPLLVLP